MTNQVINENHEKIRRRRERKVDILQPLKRGRNGPESRRAHDGKRHGRNELKRLLRGRRAAWPGLVSQQGDVARDRRLHFPLLQSRVAAVVEALEAEALDLGSGVGGRDGAAARAEARGDVRGRVRHHSRGADAGEAGLADAEEGVW